MPYYYCPELIAIGNHLNGYENCEICKFLGYFMHEKPRMTLNSVKNDRKLKNSSKAFHMPGANSQDKPKFQPQNQPVPKMFQQEDNFNDFEYEPCEEGEIILQLMERFKNCTCCKGEIYNCKGDTCKILGVCYCYLHEELEEDNNP